MRIESLAARRFRNFREVSFCPSPGTNIIFGDNAQGKTNLLEAIWLFTGHRSFRGGKDRELISAGEAEALLKLDFYSHQRPQTAEISFLEGKKRVFLNEIALSGAGELTGTMCAVVFSPDHLALVKQGPERRRKLLDQSLCQAYPKYRKVLEGYAKALKQRGFLLRDLMTRPAFRDTLETWDKVLVEYGSYISWMRARYSKKLGAEAQSIYSGISKGQESFSVRFVCSAGAMEEGASRQEYIENYQKSMRDSLERDLRTGVTAVGAHRDDLELLLDGMDSRAYGSQGQQRSCILALKLAECGILEERNGEPPIILLDDVMSELDEHRREYLLNQLTGKQVFITCCEASSYTRLEQGGVFYVQSGNVSVFE